jgi:hypothetical protein
MNSPLLAIEHDGVLFRSPASGYIATQLRYIMVSVVVVRGLDARRSRPGRRLVPHDPSQAGSLFRKG